MATDYGPRSKATQARPELLEPLQHLERDVTKLVDFRFAYFLNDGGHSINVHGGQQRGIDDIKVAFLFLSVRTTVSLPIPNTRPVSRTPLPFIAMSIICRLTSGRHAR